MNENVEFIKDFIHVFGCDCVAVADCHNSGNFLFMLMNFLVNFIQVFLL